MHLERARELTRALDRDRGEGDAALPDDLARTAELEGSDRRLAVYGTLAPGEPNHGRVADLEGEWTEGVVWGRRVEEGWGAELGYPALRLDPEGEPVRVALLSSPELPGAWSRLDRFEGPAYRRVVAPVATDAGVRLAQLYEIRRHRRRRPRLDLPGWGNLGYAALGAGMAAMGFWIFPYQLEQGNVPKALMGAALAILGGLVFARGLQGRRLESLEKLTDLLSGLGGG